MPAGVAIVGGFGNGATEEAPGWDLNKKAGCLVGWGQWETLLEEKGEGTLAGVP